MKVIESGFHSSAAAKLTSVLTAAVLPTTMAIMSNVANATNAPLNYFLHSYGPAAKPTMYLGWLLASLSVTVFLIIALLMVAAMLRKRPVADPYCLVWLFTR